jgi:hypothetical protein
LQTAVSHIFSVFSTPPETTVKALRVFLDDAKQTSTPIVVQIDLFDRGMRTEECIPSDF